jgi:hypothetical protein
MRQLIDSQENSDIRSSTSEGHVSDGPQPVKGDPDTGNTKKTSHVSHTISMRHPYRGFGDWQQEGSNHRDNQGRGEAG